MDAEDPCGGSRSPAQLRGAHRGGCRLEGSPPVSLFQLWCHHWRFHGPLNWPLTCSLGVQPCRQKGARTRVSRNLDDGSSSARAPGRRRLTPSCTGGPASQPRAVETLSVCWDPPPVQKCSRGAAVLAGQRRKARLTGQRESLGNCAEARWAERASVKQRRRSCRAERETRRRSCRAEKLRAEREPRAAQEKLAGRERA